MPPTTPGSPRASSTRHSRSAARSGSPILSTLAASATTSSLAGDTGRPTQADEAQALVDGFHVAFLGSAIAVAAGALFLLLLLRRRDAAVVAEGEPVTVPA